MAPMEIALLVIGVIIFVLSFLLPGGNEKKTEKQIAREEEEIHRLMEQELDGMKLRVNEATNDSIDYAVDRAERSLERLSNEKIMAVNDYSQTIIEEINKNHQEVMFLYDMLKDKHTDLTNSVREADATAKRIEKLSKSAKSASKGLESELHVISATKKGLTDEQKAIFDEMEVQTPEFNHIVDTIENKPAANNQVIREPAAVSGSVSDGNIVKASGNKVVMDMMSKTAYSADGNEDVMKPVMTSPQNQTSNREMTDANNSNQRILDLHNQGMATVDIAKELKLGVGEVKLVIDLFQ